MEVSSHALDLHRVADIHFKMAVYTNLTQDHLDYHKTMDEYARVKQSLFQQSEKGLFNFDDPYSYYASQVSPCSCFGYGHKIGCDFRVEEILRCDLSGVLYLAKTPDGIYEIESLIAGPFQIYNSLAAFSAAMLDGVSGEVICNALRRFQGVKGRLETLYNKDFTVIIDYAHTPDALLSVLTALKGYQQNSVFTRRLRVLFGCGGDRDRSKRPMMGHIAMLLADDVIVTSDNPRSEAKKEIIRDILNGAEHDQTATTLKVIEDRREALQYAIDSSRQGDILLVAGKGHEEYEIDCNGKHDFSERQILLERLQKNGYLL